MITDNRELISFAEKYLTSYKVEGPIVVTGATGLIGKSFIQAIEVVKPEIQVFALCRNEKKLRKEVSKNAIFVKYDLLEPISLEVKSPHIIHCAAPTSSYDFYHRANEVFDQIVISTDHIAAFAKKTEAKSLIYLSTLEIYGETHDHSKLDENSYYGLDPLNPRNSYALAKLSAENRLSFYFKDATIPVTILRSSQVLGIPSSYQDNRVIFYFARQILENKDIELQTSGRTVRNYIHYLDLIEVLFMFLEETDDGVNVYNVSHPNMDISIKELAQAFITLTNQDIKVKFVEQETLGYRDDLYLVLNVDKLTHKGWQPKYGLEKSIQSLINNMQKIRNEN